MPPEKLLPAEVYYQQYEDPTGEKTIKALDEAGIDKIVLLSLDFGTRFVSDPPTTIEQQNREIAEMQKRFPDRFIAFCAVDPQKGKYAVTLIEKAINEWGMKGIGEFHSAAGFKPNDRICYPIYEFAQEKGVPISIHVGWEPIPPVRNQTVDPLYLDDLCCDFPDLRICCCHLGSWPYDGGWNERAINMASWHRNLYLDTAMWQLQLLEKNSVLYYQVLRKALDYAPQKVMFGTDTPFTASYISFKDQIKAIQEPDRRILEKAGVKFTEEEVYDVLEGNAKRFLGLEVKR